MKKTLYITDLDGTLLDDNSKISGKTASMLNEAIGKGALFSIATARTPATVSKIMKPVDMNIPAVVMTGAALWNTRTMQYSHVQHMSSETAMKVVEAYRRHNSAAFLYTLPPERDAALGTRKFLIYHFGRMNEFERAFMTERLTNPFKRFEVEENGESLLPARIEHTVLFFGIQTSEKAEKVKRELDAIPEINPMFYHDWFGDEIAEIEAFPKGATKAKAVKRLAEEVGADRIVVFGDNRNDISMMESADLSVAVANAREEVKDFADIVIGKNTDDAVAKFILEEVEKY